jgi:DNA-binding NtrC family response regulator|tara:strand:- start:95 stop:328 length:234 start_codon:yes stop_codon:yes gene_type:complete
MELFEHFIKIIKQRREDVKELMASGAIDSMERYQYMLGQVRTYESLLQEISTLLNKKEQNDSKGTIISIKAKNNNTK